MRSWTLAFILIASLAGCADTPSPDAELAGAGEDVDGNATVDAPPMSDVQGNATPPTLVPALETLEAQAAGLGVTIYGNGTTDENATWTVDFHGDGTAQQNGTGTPFAASHTYAGPGSFTIRVNVTRGDVVEPYSVNVTVAASVPAPIVLTGNVAAPDPYYAATGFECPGAILDLGTGVSHAISNVDDWGFVLAGDGLETLFWNGSEYGSTGQVSGTVPPGSIEVQVCSVSAMDVDYTLTLTHPDFVA